jgi:hypothetical protein
VGGSWVQLPYLSYIEGTARKGLAKMIFANALDTLKPIQATQTGQRARCPDPLCNCVMMSRCSDDKDYTNHWYGYHNGICVSHFEEMSEWHRDWQNTIDNPVGGVNVEVIINGLDRYKRADLKPDHGIVIEFQKSSISYNDVKERERHYRKMIWVLHEERTFSEYRQEKTKYGNITCSKKFYPRKAWYKNQNRNIPIFIDHGDYLSSESLLSKTISKKEFISKFINSQYLNYNELGVNYWDNISNTFSFLDLIIPRIKEQERLVKQALQEMECLRIKERERIRTEFEFAQSLQREKERKERKTAELLQYQQEQEQKRIKDPALLQAIQKTELDYIEDTFITERNNWVQFTELELLKDNRARYEAKLKLEREREAELAKQINTEIINNRIKQLSKETQERIRIDLIRSTGKLEYAAEIARKKLKELGIDYNDETTRVAYGVGTQ